MRFLHKMHWILLKSKYSVAINFYSWSYKSNFFRLKYPAHVPNFTALHDAQFGEYGIPHYYGYCSGAESAPTPQPPCEKDDILKAMGIRVIVDSKRVMKLGATFFLRKWKFGNLGKKRR